VACLAQVNLARWRLRVWGEGRRPRVRSSPSQSSSAFRRTAGACEFLKWTARSAHCSRRRASRSASTSAHHASLVGSRGCGTDQPQDGLCAACLPCRGRRHVSHGPAPRDGNRIGESLATKWLTNPYLRCRPKSSMWSATFGWSGDRQKGPENSGLIRIHHTAPRDFTDERRGYVRLVRTRKPSRR
jgi:hypothetical protein